MSIQWIHFPQTGRPSSTMAEALAVIQEVHPLIDSTKKDYGSDKVLKYLSPHLQRLGFRVESGKKASQLISVPVLYGECGAIEKSFQADAWHEAARIVVEVEAGRAVANNQFLKDLFQACMMDDVSELCIVVRKIYKKQRDFDTVTTFMRTLFASRRLNLPLSSVVVVGY